MGCEGSSEADCCWTRGEAPCTATRVVEGGDSSTSGVGSCRTSCGGMFTSSPFECCGISSTAVDALPVVSSGVDGSGRRSPSPSPANVSLPDRLGPEDGVGSSCVDMCGSFASLSSSSSWQDTGSLVSRCSGTRSGSSGVWFGRRFGLVKDWVLEVRRARAEGSAERLLLLLLLLWAAKLEAEAEAKVVLVSVSVVE